MLAADTSAELQLELLLVSEGFPHVLEVVDRPDQLFLLIHILVGLITQPPFKLEDFLNLRAIEHLIDGRLHAV